MSITYTTKKGDVLDQLLWRFYSYNQGKGRNIPVAFESLFAPQPDPLPEGIMALIHELNPWLAAYPQKLPAGLTLILPESPAAEMEQQETYW